MKLRLASLASTAMLLMTPLAGAITVTAEPNLTTSNRQTWDYDTANPELGDYDQLLQNAGPSDGMVDWYPAEHFGNEDHVQASLLVQQLIELSLATNDANSMAREVLFNDTNGSNGQAGYQEIYQKYRLAFGFIAQILAFNNQKTGQGAYLKQGFGSVDGQSAGSFTAEDKNPATGRTPDRKILEVPKVGEGLNIADVLGKAFFGEASSAYAQLYLNGYDNTVQNAPNIIRESTSSITLVAQSKLTGRKATAIFKLNNKTLTALPVQSLLENEIDGSLSFKEGSGTQNADTNGEQVAVGDSIGGVYNQRSNLVSGLTSAQRSLLNNQSRRQALAWVDPKTGNGTIVVPRGTSAAEIARKIKQLGYQSNHNISNVAPMKAIHGDKYQGPKHDGNRTDDNSYNVTYNHKEFSNFVPTSLYYQNFGNEITGNVLGLRDDVTPEGDPGDESPNYIMVADPRLRPDPNEPHGYVPDSQTNPPTYLFERKDLRTNFSNSLLFSPLNTNLKDSFGLNEPFDKKETAAKIPNQITAASGTSATENFQALASTYPIKLGEDELYEVNKAHEQLGDVVHAFDPKENAPIEQQQSPFMVREAWDDTRAIMGVAPFSGLSEEQIKNQIANNGSFNNDSGDQIKKSFTYNMSLDNLLFKSYRNPYSTVISTALPFYGSEPSSGSVPEFKKGSEYDNDKYLNLGLSDPKNFQNKIQPSDQVDMNMKGFTGDYRLSPSDPIPVNQWYVNYDGPGKFDQPDNSAHPIKINGKNRPISAGSLHLSEKTWGPENELGDRLVNGDNGEDVDRKFSSWIKPSGVSDGSDKSRLTGNTHHVSGVGTAGNEPVGGGASLTPIQHLQLIKNVGYILINASELSEASATALQEYQIPSNPTGENILDGIQNSADFKEGTTLPQIYPVNDDQFYHGGLIGKQSIYNNGSQTNGEQRQANSVYTGATQEKIMVPGLASGAPVSNHFGTVQNDDKVPDERPSSQVGYVKSKGQTAADTDLHYGLAWNDSSDLPQVKIKRSLNVQYLVPVSIVRTARTTWPSGNPQTEYKNYQLFLGKVDLGGIASNQISAVPSTKPYYFSTDSKGIPVVKKSDGKIYGRNYIKTGLDDQNNIVVTEDDSLRELLPVNNQIEYTRIDQSYPHYDSELFDHGSNFKTATATRGNPSSEFVGTSEEISTDNTEAKLGSSDDYSIGIVKAPRQLFEGVDGERPFKAKPGVSQSTENAADGKAGINTTMDSPENDNGMPIGEVKSYATLAQAYQVEINSNGQVSSKPDDHTSNKEHRVKLVQQLMDNGGSSKAYYYIPSLPRLYENYQDVRINVVIYDQAAVPAPQKPETKPSFSTTDLARGDDPFNVNLRPYTTTYDDGAVLKGADVPQSFQDLLRQTLVAGNPDLINNPTRLEQTLVMAFLNSWQQNDGSFEQTDTGKGVNSPLYLYGGFGISDSDTKNSYSQWPSGYVTNTGDYLKATTHFGSDFYRGGKELQFVRGGTVKGIPASALKADGSKVDLSKAGTYPVVYTYTNPTKPQDSASITVPVTVKDAAAPVFAFQGGSDLTLKVGDAFDQNDFKVVGNWQIFHKYQGDYAKLVNNEGIARDSNANPRVTIKGKVDLTQPGIYELTYEAVNIAGIKSQLTRRINVLPTNTSKGSWKITAMTGIGYINYVPGYKINVWNAPSGIFTGQRLSHGTSWKIFQKAVNPKGQVYYNVGKNQWLDGQYVDLKGPEPMQPLNGIATINYLPGYGVNLWQRASTSGGYYPRKLPHGSKWRILGQQNGFYNVGKNQWIQAKYAQFSFK